jgi:hypothetical protein
MNHWCFVFAMKFEVTELSVVLSIGSHKGSLSFLMVLVRGFSFVLEWLVVSMPSFSIPSLLLLWGFERIVSLHFASLGYEFVHVTQEVVMVVFQGDFLM